MGDTESPVFVAGTVLVDVIVIADLILACILVTDTSSMFGIAVLVNSHVTTTHASFHHDRYLPNPKTGTNFLQSHVPDSLDSSCLEVARY